MRFDAKVPTPKLDQTADRMAEVLKDRPAGVTLTELAHLTEAPRRTVDTILHRPCDRHGDRFEICGRIPGKNGRGARAKVYRLKTGRDQAAKPEGGPRT